MKEFEETLLGRLQYCKDMQQILSSGNSDGVLDSMLLELKVEIKVLTEIIHYFNMFVKGKNTEF